MKNFDLVGRVAVGGMLLIVGIYACMYVIHKQYHNVTIQTIQDEVDLDNQKCTDNPEDCNFNNSMFTETWLFTGEKNIDPLMQFPEDVWEEKE